MGTLSRYLVARVQAEEGQTMVEYGLILALVSVVAIAILTTLGIVLSLLFESLRFFSMVPVSEFLFGTQWSPQMALRADQAGSSGAFGSIPLFWGTIFIGAIIAMIVEVLGLRPSVNATKPNSSAPSARIIPA